MGSLAEGLPCRRCRWRNRLRHRADRAGPSAPPPYCPGPRADGSDGAQDMGRQTQGAFRLGPDLLPGSRLLHRPADSLQGARSRRCEARRRLCAHARDAQLGRRSLQDVRLPNVFCPTSADLAPESRILKNLRAAAGPETRLLIVDQILPLACPDEASEAFPLGALAPANSPLLPNLGKAYAVGYHVDLLVRLPSLYPHPRDCPC